MSQKLNTLRINVTVNIPNTTETNCQHIKVLFNIRISVARTHLHTYAECKRTNENNKKFSFFFRGRKNNNNNNKNYEPKITQELVGLCYIWRMRTKYRRYAQHSANWKITSNNEAIHLSNVSCVHTK